MRNLVCLLFPILFFSHQAKSQSIDSAMVKSIFERVLTHGGCYADLLLLCKTVGHRLSGSPQADKAVELTFQMLKEAGADSVWKETVMVPHWVRGEKEQANIQTKLPKAKLAVPICALGGSVGTGAKGISAEVIEVKSIDELAQLGKAKIEGKIVFYNRPMDPKNFNTFRSYGGAVDQRSKGAIEASKYGALAVVVRSMTLTLDDNPHTGAMRYLDSIPKIPACAISTLGAEKLSKLLKGEPGLTFFMKMNCQTLPDVESANVIGEIKGALFPNEIITVGGHLDSWDLGEGAHDDGAGCVQAIEVLRLFKGLGIRPDRTIRAVMFMNEENGLMGGKKYAENSRGTQHNHIAAIESDAGGFAPIGFGFDTKNDTLKKMLSWAGFFLPWGLYDFHEGGGGADISTLKEFGTVLIGLNPESQRYFDYHHTQIDTFDKVNKRELELGAAAMAALVYFLSKYGVGR